MCPSDKAPVDSDRTSRNRFDAIFVRVAKSRTLSAIWRDVYEDDYPEDASPFSFVTVPELRWLASALNVGPGRTFVDVACGQGGPTMFVARETGATAVGIDSSFHAVEAATAAARATGMSRQATFIVADAAATGLRGARVDAVMSVDALQLMPRRDTVIGEVGRTLRPGGRFAFTTWVSRAGTAGPPFPVDYRPLLEAEGLVMDACHEPPNWESRESAVFARIRESAAVLNVELGESVVAMLMAEAVKMPEAYPFIQRVNILARKAG